MEPWVIYLGFSVAVSVATAISRALQRDEQLKHLARRPRLQISAVPDGQVARIAGKLRLADAPLVAPLSGRSCAYYEVIVEELEPDLQGGSGWATRHFDWKSCDFLVEDASGRALVHQQTPNVVLDIDLNLKPRVFRDPPPELAAYRRQLATLPQPPIIGDWGKVRVREGVLEPDELINVCGLCRWGADDNARGYRDSSRLLLVTAPPGGEIIVTDKKV